MASECPVKGGSIPRTLLRETPLAPPQMVAVQDFHAVAWQPRREASSGVVDDLGHAGRCVAHQRAEHKDHVWCWDFIFDRTTSGSPLKWLSIDDEYTPECLCLKADRSITSEDVIDTLAELFAMRGVPEHIRGDNGPEFIARAIQR